eukprot:TRINITY_DN4709_c0_g1_i1.p1 TRINITY_DN4709_c0_g1~~TRINITY_DN4709_c0_g1_i1.p1  ORF type:complete len:1246 (-),score=250.09 TRINITY_DN4709_c0_g1_i1:443-4180(-)
MAEASSREQTHRQHEEDVAAIFLRNLIDALGHSATATYVKDVSIDFGYILNSLSSQSVPSHTTKRALLVSTGGGISSMRFEGLVRFGEMHGISYIFIVYDKHCDFFRLNPRGSVEGPLVNMARILPSDLVTQSEVILRLRELFCAPFPVIATSLKKPTTFTDLFAQLERILPAIQRDVVQSLITFLHDVQARHHQACQIYMQFHRVCIAIRREMNESAQVNREISPALLLQYAVEIERTMADATSTIRRGDAMQLLVMLIIAHVSIIHILNTLMQRFLVRVLAPTRRGNQEIALMPRLFQNYLDLDMHAKSRHFSWYLASESVCESINAIFSLSNPAFEAFHSTLLGAAHPFPDDDEFDIVSGLYEICIRKSRMGAVLGQCYTPRSIVRLAFRSIGINCSSPVLNDVLNCTYTDMVPRSGKSMVKSFLDPATGSGAFISYYIKVVVQRIHESPIWNHTFLLRRAIDSICESVWGFERDFLSYEVLMYNIILSMAPAIIRLHTLLAADVANPEADQLMIQSFLHYQVPRICAFNRDTLGEFRESSGIFPPTIDFSMSFQDKLGQLPSMRFDYCAGNPPFLRRQKMDASQHSSSLASSTLSQPQTAHQQLVHKAGRCQTHCYFVTFCCEFLDRLSGELCLLTPSGWVNNVNDQRFRQYLIDIPYVTVPYVIFFPARVVFPDEQTECLLVRLSSNPQRSPFTSCLQIVGSKISNPAGPSDERAVSERSTRQRVADALGQSRQAIKKEQPIILKHYIDAIHLHLDGAPRADLIANTIRLAAHADFDKLVLKSASRGPEMHEIQAVIDKLLQASGTTLQALCDKITLGPQSGNDRILRINRAEQALLSPGNEGFLLPLITPHDVYSHYASEPSEYMITTTKYDSVRPDSNLGIYLRFASLLSAAQGTPLMPSNPYESCAKAKCDAKQERSDKSVQNPTIHNGMVVFKGKPNPPTAPNGVLLIKENCRERNASTKLLRVALTMQSPIAISKKVLYIHPKSSANRFYILAYLNSVPFAFLARHQILRRQESGLYVVKTPEFRSVVIPEANPALLNAVVANCAQLYQARERLSHLSASYFRESLLSYDGLVKGGEQGKVFYHLITLQELSQLLMTKGDPRNGDVLIESANLIIKCWRFMAEIDRLFAEIFGLSAQDYALVCEALHVPEDPAAVGIMTTEIDPSQISFGVSHDDEAYEVSQILAGLRAPLSETTESTQSKLFHHKLDYVSVDADAKGRTGFSLQDILCDDSVDE